jgi:hypothetical protein
MKIKYFAENVCGITLDSILLDMSEAEAMQFFNRYTAWRDSND